MALGEGNTSLKRTTQRSKTMNQHLWKVPVADGEQNRFVRDVLGNKSDAAVVAISEVASIMAILKGGVRTAVTAAKVMVNADAIFTIAGGPIEVIHLMSVCVTANNGTASTLQYNYTHATLGAATFSGASGSLASVAAGSFVTLQKTALNTAALLATEGVTISSTGPSTIIMQPGIISLTIGTGSTTGTWKHYLTYRPLADGVTVT